MSSSIQDQAKSAFQEHHDEIKRRSQIDSATSNKDTFDRVEGNGPDLAFEREDQQYVVYSISHTGVPPLAISEMDCALKLYACFETSEEAVEHAQEISQEDPTISIFVSKTHSWIVAHDALPKYQPSSNEAEIVSRILEQHKTEKKKNDDDFQRHLATKQVDNNVIEDITEEVVSSTPVPENHTQPKRSKKMGLVPQQNIAAATFLSDSVGTEFMFKVYGCTDTSDSAHRWVCNVIGDNVRDFNVDTVSLGHWIFPKKMKSKNVQHEVYRATELNSIMKEHKSQPQKVKQFERSMQEDPGTAM